MTPHNRKPRQLCYETDNARHQSNVQECTVYASPHGGMLSNTWSAHKQNHASKTCFVNYKKRTQAKSCIKKIERQQVSIQVWKLVCERMNITALTLKVQKKQGYISIMFCLKALGELRVPSLTAYDDAWMRTRLIHVQHA
jgi:hypothetical protein